MLITNFEKTRMKDNESFDDFYTKSNDIFNSSFNLGDRILKIVKKVMRSLPKRFILKVIVIEESKDINAIKIEELI